MTPSENLLVHRHTPVSTNILINHTVFKAFTKAYAHRAHLGPERGLINKYIQNLSAFFCRPPVPDWPWRLSSFFWPSTLLHAVIASLSSSVKRVEWVSLSPRRCCGDLCWFLIWAASGVLNAAGETPIRYLLNVPRTQNTGNTGGGSRECFGSMMVVFIPQEKKCIYIGLWYLVYIQGLKQEALELLEIWFWLFLDHFWSTLVHI